MNVKFSDCTRLAFDSNLQMKSEGQKLGFWVSSQVLTMATEPTTVMQREL